MDGFAIAFSDPPIVRQFKHGQSNPTYYVEYRGQRLVIRKKPVSNQPALITIEITLNCIRMSQCLLSRFITGCTKQELFGEAQLAHSQIFVTVMSPYFTHQIAVNLVNFWTNLFKLYMDRKVRSCLFCQCLVPATLHRFKKLFNDVYEPMQIFPVPFT